MSRRCDPAPFARLLPVYTLAHRSKCAGFRTPEAPMIRSAVVLLLVAIVSAAAQEAAKPDQEASRRLPDEVDKVFAKWDSTVSPGCALSVMKDGRIIYKRGYGMADLDHDVPITPETVFH